MAVSLRARSLFTVLGAIGGGVLALGPLAEGQVFWKACAAESEPRTPFSAARHSTSRATTRAPGSALPKPSASHDEAQALLGWSEYSLGEYRAAIISFKTALRRQPTWEGLYDGLGWSRLRLKRYHLASEEAFRAALDLNPDYIDALIGLGSAQYELGRYETALSPLQTAMRRPDPMVGGEPEELPGVRAKVAWSRRARILRARAADSAGVTSAGAAWRLSTTGG